MLMHMRSLISYQKPKWTISEQYRTLRTNIQFSNVDRNICSIMVTSSFQEEGKSTPAANLAVVYAQQGKRVLFVDPDLRKPTVQYTFQLENHIGLTNVLNEAKRFEFSCSPISYSKFMDSDKRSYPPEPG